jgi:putative membrane protein
MMKNQFGRMFALLLIRPFGTGFKPMISHRRYLTILALLYFILWAALAINPADRSTWILENILPVIFIAGIAVTYKRLLFSRISYTLIFLFMCLHTVGAHYTYSAVPYDEWFAALTGQSLNELMGWERNHFDRLVHFCYGLLLAYPIREIFLRVVDVRGFWGYFLPLDVTMSTSMIYELIEWGAAVGFGGDLGMNFLGTQGDIWDAHRDMALASLGAVIAMTLTAAINIFLQRDFAREWADSFRIKRKRPLGEDEIARLWRDKE